MASAVAEIRVHNESSFYDFDAKYLPEEQLISTCRTSGPSLPARSRAGGADV